MNYRPSISEVSVKCRSSIGEVPVKYRSCLGQVSVVNRSSIGQVSVKYRSSIGQVSVMYRSCIGHVSVMYRSSIGRESVKYRSCIRIHPHIHHTSRTPYLFHSFSDFVVYVVTTLIFPKNQRQCASFSINAAILFLSFKRATTVPNKSIDRQHYKRPRRRTRIAFHLLLHFTLTTTQLNLSFLKILNYSKTIQRLALSFRNPHLFHSNVTKT